MPLAVRYVQPKSLCKPSLPKGVKSELHAVAVFAITSAIRQVSSLAQHAEGILGGLIDTLDGYQKRMDHVGERARRIREEVLPGRDLDFEADVLFRSPLPTTHFKSDDTIDQQILSIQTSEPALLEQYERAEPKPALHLFDDSWPDKRHSLSLYSNPRFFFENWRRNMEREARRKRSSRTNSVGDELVITEKTNKAVTKYDSSTLPSRGKQKRRNAPKASNAFQSVRGLVDKKQRPKLTDDLFVREDLDQSESSGYTSQQSSYNSLSEQDVVNGTAYPPSNGWTNGPSSLTQWSTAQPPVLNGAPRGRVQSMVESFQKSGSSSKPEYGYETDITRKQRHSMYVSEEAEEQEKRKIPPIKLPKPRHSREKAMGQFAAGGRSISMSCVATADDNLPNHAPNSAQPSPGRVQRPMSYAQVENDYNFVENEAVMSKMLPEQPATSMSQADYYTSDAIPPLTKSRPPPLIFNSQPPQLTRQNSGQSDPSYPRHSGFVQRMSMGDIPLYTPQSPKTSPQQSHFVRKFQPEDPWAQQQPHHGRIGSSSSSSSASNSPGIQTRRRAMTYSASTDETRPTNRKISRGKLFRPSSGDRIRPRKHSSSDEQPPTQPRPRKNSQQILVASGVSNAVISSERNFLLTSIRKGIQLKKVQHEVEMKARMTAMPWDVAAILERRHAMEMSDNDVDDCVVQDAEWEESQ